jgi:hypothetical protein
MAKIKNEIETANWTQWQDKMTLNFLGRAATSPDVGAALGLPVAAPTSSDVATPGKDTATAPSTAKKPTATVTAAAKSSAK